MHKTIVTNAGSLRVDDLVFWERQRITEIHSQTESACDCTLVSADGSTRRHTVSSANALIVVRDGPTLVAANAAGSKLEVQPSGLPIFKRPAETEYEKDLREWGEYQSKAHPAPRIETKFLRFNPFDASLKYGNVDDNRRIDRANESIKALENMLNDGWVITLESFDEQIYQARLEREVRS